MMFSKLFLFIILCLSLLSCGKNPENQTGDNEESYKIEIQKKIGGQLEHTVKNGRVDLLTDEIAYEVTWARDWKESIGKSLWYGMQTHRDAGIILIVESKSDEKYVYQLKSTIAYMKGNKEIHILIYPKDFQ